MITKFTKPSLQALRPQIQAALDAIATEHGITLKYESTRFDESGGFFTAKISGSVIVNGVEQTKEAAEFKMFASSYGLVPEDLGAEFQHDRGTFKIVGLSTKSTRYPILVKNLGEQKTYKFTADLVRLHLGRPTSNGLTTGGSQP